MRELVIFFVLFLLGSCSPVQEKEHVEDETNVTIIFSDSLRQKTDFKPAPLYAIDSLEKKIITAGLVNIQTLIPDIIVDVRYSTPNNFMQRDMYGSLARIYLQPSVAEDLKKSQSALKEIDSTLSLYVYDGVRPRSVQQYMWDILEMPIHEKTKFVSNPKNGSLHNYGAAIDLTIADSSGVPLDMGAEYDDIRKIAYPRYEKAYLDSGLLTQYQVANRELLRKVMKAGGFWNIQTEWWHFNRYNRAKARELFEIVE